MKATVNIYQQDHGDRYFNARAKTTDGHRALVLINPGDCDGSQVTVETKARELVAEAFRLGWYFGEDGHLFNYDREKANSGCRLFVYYQDGLSDPLHAKKVEIHPKKPLNVEIESVTFHEGGAA